jgi:hypothetical protein
VNAGVAQLVEQLICNQPVASSSLVTSLKGKTLEIERFQGFSGFSSTGNRQTSVLNPG